MTSAFTDILEYLKSKNKIQLLLTGQWGIERETLRVNHDGTIALTPHPKVLTSDQITLDFAENQLEFVTHTHKKIEDVLTELEDIHDRAYQHINGELMWPFSMPPKLPKEDLIPIASFPDTEDGLEKEVYRRGLAVRYGKKLQMISGIHYNYSIDEQLFEILYQQFNTNKTKLEFRNELYLNIGRNMLKYRWLLVYLYGASPVADSSYQSVFTDTLKKDQSKWLKQFYEQLNFDKYATSLRTSRFGYSTEIEDRYQVSYQGLDQYIADLRKILFTENEGYAKIGVEKDGKPIQLNANELQSEAEFYAPIRFRQIQHGNETQLEALEKRGIAYFELRAVDINPFAKLGITKEQLEFIHLFILLCLFERNDDLTEEQQILTNENHQIVALAGRKPNVKLHLDQEQQIPLKDWAEQIFNKLIIIAEFLDEISGSDYYRKLIKTEAKGLVDTSQILSEQIITEMKNNDETYIDLGLRLANLHCPIQRSMSEKV